MSYQTLMYVHLVSVVPCAFLGAYLLLRPKGTTTHRGVGKLYMGLMFFTAIVTLFMPAHVGPRLWGHFGWIHSFSFLTIYTVPAAIRATRKGNVRSHQRKMIILYLGAIVIAGSFTFVPGRFLHTLFF